MTEYRFVTTWTVAAPRPAVWAVVDDVARWPSWWPGVTEARLLPALDGQRRLALRFRAALGYSLGFEATVLDVVPGERGEARVRGQLDGTARWELADDPQPGRERGTRLTWTWEVTPRRRWMRVLSPLARPVFRWAHDDLMRRGRDGLTARVRGHEPPPTRPPR